VAEPFAGTTNRAGAPSLRFLQGREAFHVEHFEASR